MRSIRPLLTHHLRLRPPPRLPHLLTPHDQKPYSSSPLPPPPLINPESYLASARQKFVSQPPKIISATLTRSKADQLTLALEDANPAFRQSHGEFEDGDPLPQGYHMVYFEPKMSSYQPMADGTDPYHFPGRPFARRMWVGGEVNFEREYMGCMLLGEGGKETKAECREWVESEGVEVKGGKVFVEVGREYFALTGEEKVKVLTEKRRLVFLRPLEEELARQVERLRLGDKKAVERKKIKVPWRPFFSFSLRPDAQFLSLFSVLTSNAHRIHLDSKYARVEEGYKDVLVHGPLTLVLMLEGLASYLHKSGKEKRRWIKSMSYRNLAPLFKGDEVRVCGALAKSQGGGEGEEEWVVWIEDFEGGLAVKGSATVVGRQVVGP
ncbi:hypothetical protein QC761_708075 [Podospora bellae-mahoneyi]|uniref:MaoC-like domain-containing protein n=1 Tax=Podospora bellae-mahoneyi TaxID=2093777 RepID=A0ABR0F610_9PEZI|nr:hypothetical protein QC761_708075 [Podospora bellae-mahoneyi]